MPPRALRPCSSPGCAALVTRGRCPAHQAAQEQTRKDFRPLERRRPSSAASGYDWKWREFRAWWLRAHPLCGDRLGGRSGEHSQCAREGRAVAASQVDHIVPLRADRSRLLDQTNVQSLCHSCHSRKTRRDRC